MNTALIVRIYEIGTIGVGSGNGTERLNGTGNFELNFLELEMEIWNRILGAETGNKEVIKIYNIWSGRCNWKFGMQYLELKLEISWYKTKK